MILHVVNIFLLQSTLAASIAERQLVVRIILLIVVVIVTHFSFLTFFLSCILNLFHFIYWLLFFWLFFQLSNFFSRVFFISCFSLFLSFFFWFMFATARLWMLLINEREEALSQVHTTKSRGLTKARFQKGTLQHAHDWEEAELRAPTNHMQHAERRAEFPTGKWNGILHKNEKKKCCKMISFFFLYFFTQVVVNDSDEGLNVLANWICAK